jgi:putative transcriptional regulator
MNIRWLLAAAAAAASAVGADFAAVAPPFPSISPSELAAGKFLVARPNTGGPYFHRTVILLLEYGRSGAVGLILNRPTDIALTQLIPDMESLKGRSDHAFLGGPVEGGLMLMLYRASEPPPNTHQVIGNTHVSGSFDTLNAFVEGGAKPGSYRVYVGYSGWAPRQLEAEVLRGAWLIEPADERMVFEMDSDKVWRELIHRSERIETRLRSTGGHRGARSLLCGLLACNDALEIEGVRQASQQPSIQVDLQTLEHREAHQREDARRERKGQGAQLQ